MKIFEITEAKVEMCPEACCGKPVTECACGPDCKHCDCHAKNKMNEDEDLGNLIKTGVKGSYDFIAKTIKDFEELIRNNPNHPKVPQVKAELAKLRPQLAQARKDSGMGESATAGATSAGALSTSMAGGNGFASGGIGSKPIKRVPNEKPKAKKKKKSKA